MELMNRIRNIISPINNSPFLAGITMIMLNIGSKYIEIGFSKTQEEALRAGLAREMLLFSMVFMATKDIIISILMTAAFIVLSDHLLNEKSKLCIIPKRLRQLELLVDRNKDNIITDKEINDAENILRRAQKQKKFEKQAQFVSFLDK
jgi:hypothetical protein